MTDKAAENDQWKRLAPLLTLGGLLAILLWSYWNSLEKTAGQWENPKYSHGYLVPVFTLILLWLRRDLLAPFDNKLAYIGGGIIAGAAAIFAAAMSLNLTAAQTSGLELFSVQLGVVGALLLIQQPMNNTVSSSARWAGVGLLALGVVIRLLATRYLVVTAEMPSIVPAILGVFLLVGGWPLLKWAGAPLAYLVFMFPLPGPLDARLLGPLQRIATEASTYCLQTLGIPAVNEFNKIVLNGETTMEVVEACSGLRMLTIFGALAVAITMVTQRPLWEKIVIVLSTVPIALAVNITRITLTGILYVKVGEELTERLFHDAFGLLMVPLALGLLYIEFQVLSHLIIDDGMTGPVPIANHAPRPAATR
jgi:exosortase